MASCILYITLNLDSCKPILIILVWTKLDPFKYDFVQMVRWVKKVLKTSTALIPKVVQSEPDPGNNNATPPQVFL